MERAYSDNYIDDAQENLGFAFDYAAKEYGIDPDIFLDYFINSGIAYHFEIGNPKYIAGKSGIELVYEIFKRMNKNENIIKEPSFIYNYSNYYWCGYILCYFQWFHNISFNKIRQYLNMKELDKLYSILHEVSEQKAIELIKKNIINNNKQTLLQRIRLNNNLSQNELSKLSGVSLRMIQQYEQKQKDINKASINTLNNLSKILNCTIEDLMEIEFMQ